MLQICGRICRTRVKEMVTMTTVEIPSSTAPTTTTKTASRTLTKVGCDVYCVYVEKNECDDDIDDEIDDNK